MRVPVPQNQQFREDWWKIRMLLKGKIKNPSTEMSIKTWKNIKRALKQELAMNGYSAALEKAKHYLPTISGLGPRTGESPLQALQRLYVAVNKKEAH